MKVFLFYLSDAKYGGWPTFTCHLALALRSINITPIIVKLAKRTSRNPRVFGRQFSCYHATLNDAVYWATHDPSMVVVSSPKVAKETNALVAAGARWCVHDPTELKGSHQDETVRASRHPVVTIGKAIAPLIESKGNSAEFLPHPYTSIGVGVGNIPTEDRTVNATSVSRIDFDKNSHIVAGANALLSDDKRIAIYGSLNRLYAFHKLDKDYPKWREAYRGAFSNESLWSGSFISREGNYAVDMSTISGDGGRTQYTFLEAWDAGATLVLNRQWLTGDDDIDEVKLSSLFVSDAPELARTLRANTVDPAIATNAKQLLQQHAPSALRAQLLKLW